MSLYKYVSNRLLAAIQNLVLGYKLSEYHTGHRGFTRELLEALPPVAHLDHSGFDGQMPSLIIC